LFNYMRQTVESGRAPSIEERKNILTVERGKDHRHFQFSVTPMPGKSGSLLGVVLLLRDVTRLTELDRLKSEFVMTASHELRTPLTSIGMSIKLLLEKAMGKLDQKEQQLLAAAHEDLQRLKMLVSNLLDLSRIEAGKMEMRFERVSVEMLFKQVISLMKTQADEQAIDLRFDLPENLPDVKADPTKVSWVLTNLVSNALRYTNRGGHIRVSAEKLDPYVHISVSDDGAGIPFEDQSKIFDKFVQIKSDKVLGGSGLGLAICKEIVRAHGGTLWVDSSPGEGSTFTFTLSTEEKS
jgi:NtrC-family two-component system sensor histidine kinase KinB